MRRDLVVRFGCRLPLLALAACQLDHLVSAPPVARLAFTVQPGNVVAGQTITPPVRIAALDDAGDTVTSFTGRVIVDVADNPSGGALAGPRATDAVGGIATFSSLQIDRPGTGYTLHADSWGLTRTTSAPFDVAPPPTDLTFTVQPGTTMVGQAIAPPVEVTALDASGNPVSGFSGAVTVALAPNTLGARVSGTLTVTAVNGVARFADLTVDLPGTDYRLTAAFAGNPPRATSQPFAVLP